MKKIQIAGIAVFCVLLFSLSAASLVLPQKERSDRENRELALRPPLSVKSVLSGGYQEAYETYLSDQMPCRDTWVNLSASLEYAEGKKDINNVYVGSDGYLLEKYDFSNYDAEQIQQNIESLAEFLNDATDCLGAEHVRCLMVPCKSTVLSEKLPAFADAETEEDLMSALQDAIEQPEVLLDLRPVLAAHDKEYIFYRTDHHWTTLGAFYAYQALNKSLGIEVPTEDAYERRRLYTDFYGTTYNKVHLPVTPDIVEQFWHENQKNLTVTRENAETPSDSLYFEKCAAEGFNRYDVFFGGNTFQITVNTHAAGRGTLLVIKDSFANCFVPFLSGEYEKIIMLDYRYGKQNVSRIVEEIGGVTDVLVLYNTDTFRQETQLHRLDSVGVPEEESTIEEFDADTFFDELDDEEEESDSEEENTDGEGSE